MKKDLEAAKIPVVLFEGINAGDSDYSAIITKLKSQGVDFVYFGGYHPEMGLLMRQAREQGVKATFMGPEGVGNKDVTAIAGPASEGMLVTLPADFSADPANAALVKAFADKARPERPVPDAVVRRGEDHRRLDRRSEDDRSDQGRRVHAQDDVRHADRQGRV